jgi:glycerol-3-phosphate acyltransferase PlsY
MVAALVIVVASYAIGSLPIAWLAGRAMGVDLRERGSGNVGASNVWQTASRALVVPVGLAQIAQGAAGPLIAVVADAGDGAAVAAGLAAIVAHDWNPWLRFAGGRGIGPTIGVLLVTSPVGLVVFIGVSLLGVVLRAVPQFVALGLIAAPLAAAAAGDGPIVVLGCGLAALLAMIKRLHGNGIPDAAIERPQVWLTRLLCDRDIRDREAWVRRASIREDVTGLDA